MIKRKIKLTAAIGLLALSIFGLIIGVYAAAIQRQISISGTIKFSASTLRAGYVVSRTDAYAGEAPNYTTTVLTGSFNDANNTDQNATLGEIVLSDTANRFAFKVEITNNEAVRTVEVNYTLPTVAETWITLYVNGVEAATATPITLTYGQSETVEFVYVANSLEAPASVETPISISSNFIISLPDADTETSAQPEQMSTFQKATTNHREMVNSQTPTSQRQIVENQRENNARTYEGRHYPGFRESVLPPNDEQMNSNSQSQITHQRNYNESETIN